MSGIFSAITDFFTTIFSIIEFLFKALILLFKLLFKGMEFLLNVIGLLPAPFLVGGVLLVVVCIVYKVLGRENQS